MLVAVMPSTIKMTSKSPTAFKIVLSSKIVELAITPLSRISPLEMKKREHPPTLDTNKC